MTLTGPTPIRDAVYRGDAAGLTRLLGAGGRPPLHAAIAGAAGARVVAALLGHGADVNAEDAGGRRG
jgi:hypothetical protein